MTIEVSVVNVERGGGGKRVAVSRARENGPFSPVVDFLAPGQGKTFRCEEDEVLTVSTETD